MKRALAATAVAVAFAAAACSSDDTAAPPTTPAPDATATAAGTSVAAISASTVISTTVTPSSNTSMAPTSLPPTTMPTTTSPPTTTTVTPGCDRSEAIAIVDAAAELARLEPGGTWETGVDSPTFDDRTNTAEEFTYRVAYTCGERFVQITPDGAERLALVAWNDLRHAVVLQATDPPTQPYRTDAAFQLYIEQPYGEFLVKQFIWAATMQGGESIVIATRDYSAALTAKSWQSAVPRFDDLPVRLDAEQFAIDALIDVGARNVSVAEPASVGYPIGTIQFNTPLALGAFAVIGPANFFDPMVPLVPDGDSTYSDVNGVEVRLTVGKELSQFDLYEAGWSCGEHSWRLYAGLGSPGEVLNFTETLVRSLTCT